MAAVTRIAATTLSCSIFLRKSQEADRGLLSESRGVWRHRGKGGRKRRIGGIPNGDALHISWEAQMEVERISAVTLKVASMRNSVRFYRDVLGMEIIYGDEDGCFSSLRAKDANTPILNLEQGYSVARWGRMIFYVAAVAGVSEAG